MSQSLAVPAKSETEVMGKQQDDSLANVIESCRSYLLLVAERAMSPDLRVKEGASDLVQEAVVEAQRHVGRWTAHAKPSDELRAWLCKFLTHKIAHAARRYRGSKKRQMAREISLGTVEGDIALAETLISDQTSVGTRAARREEEAALQAALSRLPDRMRNAIGWRHNEDCSFDVIGQRLGCSNVAARKLWLRALEQLQSELKTERGPAA
jgi:RNA polymerase sigma-70 factor (ECF subfamily)